MSRFSLLAVSLLIVVAIGAEIHHRGGLNKSMCVCIPSRAGLMVKSAVAKTKARSANLFTVRAAAVGQ